MEYLSRMLALAFKQKKVEYHSRCKKTNIQCLLFADDLLIFCKATKKSLQGVKDVLHAFSRVTGLSINPAKSMAYFSQMEQTTMDSLLNILQIQRGTFPVSYLGLPISGASWTASTCQKLVDKIKIRLQAWKGRMLSYAGKIELINTVLLSITSYWISVFKLPVSVFDEIESICRDFLWGYQEGKKGLYPIAWTTLCLPHQNGGAGIKDPFLWGQALLCKQIWAIQQKEDNMWIKWVQEFYMSKANSWRDCTSKHHATANWKQLVELKNEVLHSLPSCVSPSGKFRVSHAYTILLGQRSTKSFYTTIWSKRILPKQAFFLWMLALGRLSTLDRLHSLGLHLNLSACALCGHLGENAPHVFIHCSYAQQVYGHLQLPQPQDLRQLRRALFIWQKRKTCHTFSLMVSALYYLWQERNRRIFRGNARDSLALSLVVSSEHRLWH